jgi:hypothetical protein
MPRAKFGSLDKKILEKIDLMKKMKLLALNRINNLGHVRSKTAICM